MPVESISRDAAFVKARRLALFERYLSLWVAICMLIGVVLGKAVAGITAVVRGLEFAHGSQINVPIAVLIWLMITPMMMKVDLSAVPNAGRRPTGLVITLFVNWVVKPFSMAALAWTFFRVVFAPWISPVDAGQYIAGCIILAAAPCTAIVFVWSHLTNGDPAYTLVQGSVTLADARYMNDASEVPETPIHVLPCLCCALGLVAFDYQQVSEPGASAPPHIQAESGQHHPAHCMIEKRVISGIEKV